MYGLDIKIEVKGGQYRYFDNGKKPRVWPADYGDINGTKGNDGDPLDVFVGMFKNAEMVYVINKYNGDGENRKFDEHKIMLGFFDRNQAVDVYHAAYPWEIVEETDVVPVTPAQLKWWLENANKRLPIQLKNLPFDPLNKESGMNENVTYDWADENRTAAKAIYDMRLTDDTEELQESMELADFVAELQSNGEILEGAEEAAFDALVIQNKALPRKANLIGKSLNAAGTSLNVVENGIQVSEPYRSKGVTQVAVVFELSDGQTVSIMLHNQDAAPSKLTPEDQLIAWRWYLNKKDITIVVAKENGQDQNIRLIARKVMALAEKNADKFAKANARRAERQEALKQEQSSIENKESELNTLMEEIKSLKEQIKEAKEHPKQAEPSQEDAEEPAQEADNTPEPKQPVKLADAKDFLLEEIFGGDKGKVLLGMVDKDGKILEYKIINDNKVAYTRAYNEFSNKYKDNENSDGVRKLKFADIEFADANSANQAQNELERSAKWLEELGYTIDRTVDESKLNELPLKVGDFAVYKSGNLNTGVEVVAVANTETNPMFSIKNLHNGYTSESSLADINEQIESGVLTLGSKEDAMAAAAKNDMKELAVYTYSNGKPFATVSKNEYGLFEVSELVSDLPSQFASEEDVIRNLKVLAEGKNVVLKSGEDLLAEPKPEEGVPSEGAESEGVGAGAPEETESTEAAEEGQSDADVELLKRVAKDGFTDEEKADEARLNEILALSQEKADALSDEEQEAIALHFQSTLASIIQAQFAS